MAARTGGFRELVNAVKTGLAALPGNMMHLDIY